MNNLAIVETILRNRHQFFAEIREGVELNKKMQSMLISSIAFFALYEAVIGSTHSLRQMLSSTAKLPLLFLATLVVCSPTLYFFNLIFGSNPSLTQNFAHILTAIMVTAVLLSSLTPIVLFFLLTTNSYQFFKLLNNLDRFEIRSPLHMLLKRNSLHIYRLEGGEKRWIRDIDTFVAEGHVWEDVRFVSCGYLCGLPDGETIPPESSPPPQP